MLDLKDTHVILTIIHTLKKQISERSVSWSIYVY